jgi:hypothetical protein
MLGAAKENAVTSAITPAHMMPRNTCSIVITIDN